MCLCTHPPFSPAGRHAQRPAFHTARSERAWPGRPFDPPCPACANRLTLTRWQTSVLRGQPLLQWRRLHPQLPFCRALGCTASIGTRRLSIRLRPPRSACPEILNFLVRKGGGKYRTVVGLRAATRECVTPISAPARCRAQRHGRQGRGGRGCLASGPMRQSSHGQNPRNRTRSSAVV